MSIIRAILLNILGALDEPATQNTAPPRDNAPYDPKIQSVRFQVNQGFGWETIGMADPGVENYRTLQEYSERNEKTNSIHNARWRTIDQDGRIVDIL